MSPYIERFYEDVWSAKFDLSWMTDRKNHLDHSFKQQLTIKKLQLKERSSNELMERSEKVEAVSEVRFFQVEIVRS